MQEDGFHFTMNIGQVLQILGFVVPAIVLYGKMTVREAMHVRDMTDLRKEVSVIQSQVLTIVNDMKQMPALVQATARNTAVVKNVAERGIPVPRMDDDAMAEFVQRLREELAKDQA